MIWTNGRTRVLLRLHVAVNKIAKRLKYESGTYVKGTKPCDRRGSDDKCRAGTTSETPNMYQERKISPCLPLNDPCRCYIFLPPLEIPSGVFRVTTGETLGPCAGPCNTYKNPEYFAYHNMSYYDLNSSMFKFRCDRVNSHRKQR